MKKNDLRDDIGKKTRPDVYRHKDNKIIDVTAILDQGHRNHALVLST